MNLVTYKVVRYVTGVKCDRREFAISTGAVSGSTGAQVLPTLGGRPRVKMPKPTDTYFKLHISTEIIGRNSEKLSKLKPPVELGDPKSTVSGVTKGKGPASKVAAQKKSPPPPRKKPSSARVNKLRSMTAEVAAKKQSATKSQKLVVAGQHSKSAGPKAANANVAPRKTSNSVIADKKASGNHKTSPEAGVKAPSKKSSKSVIPDLQVSGKQKSSPAASVKTSSKKSSNSVITDIKRPSNQKKSPTAGTKTRGAGMVPVPPKGGGKAKAAAKTQPAGNKSSAVKPMAKDSKKSPKSGLSPVVSGKTPKSPAGGAVVPKKSRKA